MNRMTCRYCHHTVRPFDHFTRRGGRLMQLAMHQIPIIREPRGTSTFPEQISGVPGTPYRSSGDRVPGKPYRIPKLNLRLPASRVPGTPYRIPKLNCEASFERAAGVIRPNGHNVRLSFPGSDCCRGQQEKLGDDPVRERHAALTGSALRVLAGRFARNRKSVFHRSSLL